MLLLGVAAFSIGAIVAVKVWIARDEAKVAEILRRDRQSKEEYRKRDIERQKVEQGILSRLTRQGMASRAPWSGHLKGISGGGGWIIISTDMKIEPAQRESYKLLCDATSTLIFRPEYEALDVSRVRLTDGNEKVGAARNSREGACVAFDKGYALERM